ncbi:hypothetical protein [uncultured Sphingomonas sp.]|uniref:hypothetical protein n=1 Tax=uncultured Sphingomonas sp. TaxID=158754 RepID=UPI0026366BFF|nr:hypothetical protein [uncultured Sphingomonas sp.]
MKPLGPTPPESTPRHGHGSLVFCILTTLLFGAAWLILCRLPEADAGDRWLLLVGAVAIPLAAFVLIGCEWLALRGERQPGDEARRGEALSGDDFVTIWPAEAVWLHRLPMLPEGQFPPSRRALADPSSRSSPRLGHLERLLRGAAYWLAAHNHFDRHRQTRH